MGHRAWGALLKFKTNGPVPDWPFGILPENDFARKLKVPFPKLRPAAFCKLFGGQQKKGWVGPLARGKGP